MNKKENKENGEQQAAGADGKVREPGNGRTSSGKADENEPGRSMTISDSISMREKRISIVMKMLTFLSLVLVYAFTVTTLSGPDSGMVLYLLSAAGTLSLRVIISIVAYAFDEMECIRLDEITQEMFVRAEKSYRDIFSSIRLETMTTVVLFFIMYVADMACAWNGTTLSSLQSILVWVAVSATILLAMAYLGIRRNRRKGNAKKEGKLRKMLDVCFLTLVFFTMNSYGLSDARLTLMIAGK